MSVACSACYNSLISEFLYEALLPAGIRDSHLLQFVHKQNYVAKYQLIHTFLEELSSTCESYAISQPHQSVSFVKNIPATVRVVGPNPQVTSDSCCMGTIASKPSYHNMQLKFI